MKPGYVYAIQPEGMDICKVGCCANPEQRAKEIAAYSPVPMRFRHIIRMCNKRTAHVVECRILGICSKSMHHAEWANVSDDLDRAFADIPGAENCLGEFTIPEIKPRILRPMSDEQYEFRVAVAQTPGVAWDTDYVIARTIGLKSTAISTAKALHTIPDGFWEKHKAHVANHKTSNLAAPKTGGV